MALIANGFRDSNGVTKIWGATLSNNGYPVAAVGNNYITGAQRNITAGTGISSELVSKPSGNRHPNCWMMPQKPGALAARNELQGEGDTSFAITGGVNGQATLAGAGDLVAIGALIISLVASISGSGTISNAQAQAFLNLAATLAGEGDIQAALGALANASASLAAAGDVSSTATALGTLAASITVSGSMLTTTNVGQAVWSAVAAVNNEPGTMGEKLNDAGSGADPWSDPKALTVTKFIALK